MIDYKNLYLQFKPGFAKKEKEVLEKVSESADSAAENMKKMGEAFGEFDKILHGVRRAGASKTPSLPQHSRRQVRLHQKAIEKRRKRKRGGPK
jgi:hypothetical protein